MCSSDLYSRTEHLFSVWGISPNDVWVVGSASTIVRWNGTGWTVTYGPISSGPSFKGIDGLAADRVFVVGWNGSVMYWNGASWRQMASVGDAVTLEKVEVLAVNDAYATGGGASMYHFNGLHWTAVPNSSGRGWYGIWAASPTDIWVAGGTRMVHGAP